MDDATQTPLPEDHPEPPPEALVVEAGTLAAIDTTNAELQDGINRCPSCGATDVKLRASSGMLVCLFCRHEWSEAKIEGIVAQEGDLDDLIGTQVASGAADISAEAAGVMTLKCGGCGSDVVVNIDETTSSRCHWCRHAP